MLGVLLGLLFLSLPFNADALSSVRPVSFARSAPGANFRVIAQLGVNALLNDPSTLVPLDNGAYFGTEVPAYSHSLDDLSVAEDDLTFANWLLSSCASAVGLIDDYTATAEANAAAAIAQLKEDASSETLIDNYGEAATTANETAIDDYATALSTVDALAISLDAIVAARSAAADIAASSVGSSDSAGVSAFRTLLTSYDSQRSSYFSAAKVLMQSIRSSDAADVAVLKSLLVEMYAAQLAGTDVDAESLSDIEQALQVAMLNVLEDDAVLTNYDDVIEYLAQWQSDRDSQLSSLETYLSENPSEESLDDIKELVIGQAAEIASRFDAAISGFREVTSVGVESTDDQNILHVRGLVIENPGSLSHDSIFELIAPQVESVLVSMGVSSSELQSVDLDPVSSKRRLISAQLALSATRSNLLRSVNLLAFRGNLIAMRPVAFFSLGRGGANLFSAAGRISSSFLVNGRISADLFRPVDLLRSSVSFAAASRIGGGGANFLSANRIANLAIARGFANFVALARGPGGGANFLAQTRVSLRSISSSLILVRGNFAVDSEEYRAISNLLRIIGSFEASLTDTTELYSQKTILAAGPTETLNIDVYMGGDGYSFASALSCNVVLTALATLWALFH